jgi:phospholipid/cholesterol/gamma-HCH transport system permease protein
MIDLVGRLGRRTKRRVRRLMGMSDLVYRAFKSIPLEWRRGRRLVIARTADQVYFTAIEPLGFFALAALIFGVAGLVQSDQVLARVGLSHYVPDLVVTALVREIAPLVVAMILIGRSGPAIAAELGSMAINRELDALELQGINIDYLVVLPRIVGVTLATISCVVIFSTIAIVGGFIVGKATGLVSASVFFDMLVGALVLCFVANALVAIYAIL